MCAQTHNLLQGMSGVKSVHPPLSSLAAALAAAADDVQRDGAAVERRLRADVGKHAGPATPVQQQQKQKRGRRNGAAAAQPMDTDMGCGGSAQLLLTMSFIVTFAVWT